ncbi:MAG: 3-deoxy-D-manno-octulosonic acid kinase [Gammaproteobacteria bacterium]|nr:3-deoxy-D-manno-octulosonic acid kinase [Gammaproteobacteria bacterium]
MARRIETIGKSVIVYDDSLVSHIEERLFEPDSWPDAGQAPGYAGGRGSTLFIEHGGQHWVLRHYHRGGLMSRWLDDQFPRFGVARSRPFREWDLLARLTKLNLPSPRPVAGRIVMRGLIYSADLITVRIPDVEPLSTRLARGPLNQAGWRRIGELVARFHAARVFHADLTAHNIQIDSAGHMYLVDFDRGRLMPGPGAWTQNNINRLLRSLRKVSQDGSIVFTDAEWQWLLAGYHAG